MSRSVGERAEQVEIICLIGSGGHQGSFFFHGAYTPPEAEELIFALLAEWPGVAVFQSGERFDALQWFYKRGEAG